MIENPFYDRVLADQEEKTKLPKFQLYQINRGDFIGIPICINLLYIRSIRWNLKNLFVREPHFEVSQEQNMF